MRRYRIAGLVVAAVAVLAVAFVALRPGDDEGATTPRPSDAPVATSPAPSPETTTETTEPAPEPEPAAPLLEPDGTQEIRVGRGETVRFRVRSPQDDEIHVHGYDLTKEVPAGETVTMRFPADIEGIFEIELEQSGMALGQLRVDP